MVKSNKNIEKSTTIAKYVIEGMMNVENDKFVGRLAVILTNRNELLDFLVDGVPIAVTIIDEDLIIQNIENVKSVKSVTIDNDFDIVLNVVKVRKRYFRTQEEANNSASCDGRDRYSEETPICREFEYNATEYLTYALKDAIEIEYL